MFTPKVSTSKVFTSKVFSLRIYISPTAHFLVPKMTQTIALAGALSLLVSPYQAQVVKGMQQQPGDQRTESPGQFHARLRRTMGPGRMSPKIVRPTAQQLTISGIRSNSDLAVLRTQKLNADREVQDLALTITGKSGPKTTAKSAAGPANYPGGPAGNNTTGGTQIRNQNSALPAVIKTNTKAATGPGGGPGIQGPLKTESASVSPSPGSSAQANIAVQSCPQPTISTISGFPTVTFTPIALFNPYTIKGCGFGNQMGKVYLSGPFFAGKIDLTVQTSGGDRRAPARASWSDTTIVVSVDPQLSGELNQDNVTLVVEPVGGSPIQKAGNRFLAFHEDVMLQTIPRSAVTFFQGVAISTGGKKSAPTASGGSTVATAGLAQVSTPDPVYYSPAGSVSAEVFREGMTLEFFLVGSDLFDLSGLSPAFQGEYFQLQSDPTPEACLVEGSWKAVWEGKKVRVNWEEFLCKRGPMSAVWSDYGLSVVVNGPRGIDPWTGRRLLTAVPARSVAR